MKPIFAIVADGFHRGHSLHIPYTPVLRLPKPRVARVDWCCGGDKDAPDYIEPAEILEYKECFRAADQEVVIYSTTGKSTDIFGMFPHEVTSMPWIPNRTTLYMGYHDERAIREDIETAQASHN